MYCKKCGLVNRPNSQFCANCGSSLSAPTISPPTVSFQQTFHDSWCSFASSNYTLILTIIFSLYVFLFGRELASALIDSMSGGKILSAVLELIPSLSNTDSSTLFTFSIMRFYMSAMLTSLFINLVFQFLLDLVTVVGLWMLYLSNRKGKSLTATNSTTSLHVMKARFIASVANLVLSVFLSVCSAILSNDTESSIGSILTAVFVSLFSLLYNYYWLKLLNSACEALITSLPSTKYITLPCVFLCITGVLLTVILLFIPEPSILFICAAINPFLFAVLLYRYKNIMRDLQALRQFQEAPSQIPLE